MPSTHSEFPEAGDLYWLDFGMPSGHEQAGRRPVLVISSRAYNAASSFVVVCPVTRQQKAWPYKVPLTAPSAISGFVLVDQVRSVDRRLRLRRFGGRVSPESLSEVRSVLASILGIPVLS